ncbi:hypothetical protein, partial [Bradyrhizobium sp.]|uniref:hypothetical protein n=1 Tax=Bradyrhizobium sp. TaxID=376 RepID=UPI0025C40143
CASRRQGQSTQWWNDDTLAFLGELGCFVFSDPWPDKVPRDLISTFVESTSQGTISALERGTTISP